MERVAEVDLLQDPRRFADLAGRWLSTDPFTTNVIGVHLDGVLRGLRRRGGGDLWIAARDRGEIVGAAMHAPPHHVFLPRLPVGVAAAIALTLVGVGRAVEGVNGEAGAVAEFVEAWRRRTGGSSRLVMKQRVYRLGSLDPPAAVAGSARPARAADRRLLVAWFDRFHAEATPNRPGETSAATVDRRLPAGQLWLWCAGGERVSLAGHSAAVAGVARVAPVYTPPEHRRHGYGAAITAAATSAALLQGAREVILYADLGNPTSNSVYQAIGYRPDHDAVDQALIAGGAGAQRPADGGRRR
jgi:predicted GNAT family acetyltransferase